MKSKLKLVKNIVFGAIIALLITLAFFIVLSRIFDKNLNFFGNQYYVVSSGSMVPTLEIGDVILVKEVDFEDIKDGDVLTYISQINGKDAYITHRVVRKGDGFVITKGDRAGATEDSPVYAADIVGVMKGKSGFLTFVYNIFQNKVGFFLTIILPIFVLLIMEIIDLVKNYYVFKDERAAKVAAGSADKTPPPPKADGQ